MHKVQDSIPSTKKKLINNYRKKKTQQLPRNPTKEEVYRAL
jgi:hypothetical protein